MRQFKTDFVAGVVNPSLLSESPYLGGYVATDFSGLLPACQPTHRIGLLAVFVCFVLFSPSQDALSTTSLSPLQHKPLGLSTVRTATGGSLDTWPQGPAVAS